MKKIVSFDKAIGSDGLEIEAAVGVEASNLKARVELTYPIEAVIQPATKAADKLLDKLEKLIPGDWDKPIIEKLKQEFRQELVEALSE